MRRIDVPPGTVFGRLTVIEEAHTPSGRRAMLCRCECGEQKTVDLAHLRSGHTRSCGCLHDEIAAEITRTNPLIIASRTSDLRREQARQRAEKHGLSHHRHYVRWRNMVDRCTNPENANYHSYGGRGIKVCPEWRDVAVFCAWIDENLGPRPAGMSMDRINNDGNYEPGNVQWATAKQQLSNFRGTPVRGEECWQAKLTTADVAEIRQRHAEGDGQTSIAEEYGMNPSTIGAIVAGKTWRHAGGPVTAPRGGSGETHPNAKLTWAAVASIRARVANGEARTVLAREFGVSKQAIASVVRGNTWRQGETGDATTPPR
jgi:hypothetical protein